MISFLTMSRVISFGFAPLLLGLAITGIVISSGNAAAGHSPTPQNFKVAFIGDQGFGSDAIAVLNLIKAERANMVLHQGDFDYLDDPELWDQQINDVLGMNFPYFASVGNHDVPAFEVYQQKLQVRLDSVDGAACTGDLGVKSACSYGGLFFVLSGVGTLGWDHDIFIRDQLAADNSIWRICSWHKNHRLMQVGSKLTAVGWENYEECRKGGAIVANGHEHSYSRTYLMDDFEMQGVASTSSILNIEKGKTFAFVSGLGGHSIRGQNDELAGKAWWAAVYTAAQGANFGALFCTFNKDGVESRAHCYFKDIDGNIPDEFDLEVAVHSPLPILAVSLIGLGTLAGLLSAWMFWHFRQRRRRLRTE